MADFSWLNDIPDGDWSRQKEGFCRTFDLHQFLEESDAAEDGAWIRDFDEWGATQKRRYQQFLAPPVDGRPVAFITFFAE